MQIYFNDNFINEEDLILRSTNRSFKYGDGLFETIFVADQNPLFIDLHFNRLCTGMNLLGIEIPQNWDNHSFKRIIIDLSKRNNLQNARCRITIWRAGDGLYFPLLNTAEFLIELSEHVKNEYELNPVGIKLGIFNEIPKLLHPLSAIKTANSLVYILAAKYASEQNLNDVVILNQEGRIADTISSNIFIFRNNQLFTPSVNEGGIDGIMKKIIIELCMLEGFGVNQEQLKLDDLNGADEIFLSNVISGIKWVSELHNKKYANKFSTDLVYILNEAIRNNTLVSA